MDYLIILEGREFMMVSQSSLKKISPLKIFKVVNCRGGRNLKQLESRDAPLHEVSSDHCQGRKFCQQHVLM